MSTNKHRITAARTYYAIARRQASLFHEFDTMRTTLDSAPFSETELAERFQVIETNYEQQQQAAMIAVTFLSHGTGGILVRLRRRQAG